MLNKLFQENVCNSIIIKETKCMVLRSDTMSILFHFGILCLQQPTHYKKKIHFSISKFYICMPFSHFNNYL